jgi:hypothetical protein
MLQIAPQLEAAFPDLLHAAANHFRFVRRQHGIITRQTFRLNQHAVGFTGERHEIAHANVERIEHLAGNNHLAALTQAADSFGRNAFVAIISGYPRAGDCQADLRDVFRRLNLPLPSVARMMVDLMQIESGQRRGDSAARHQR